MSVAKIWHAGQWIPIALGEQGAPGSDGRDVNFQVSGTTLQYQHVGDSTWINLFDFSTLNGGGGVAPLPSVTSVSPSTAASSGTQTITITGTHLTGTTQVQLRETDGTTQIQNLSSVTVVSDTQVTAVLNVDLVTTPDRGSAKRLYVTTGAGSAFGTLVVAAANAPSVTSVSPATTATTGTATVTVTGTNLTGVTQMALMDPTGFTVIQYLSAINVVSGTQVTGVLNIDTVADNYRGAPMRLYVTNTNGTAYGTMTVAALAPTVSSITPATMAANAITPLSILGNHLYGATSAALYAVDGTTKIVDLGSVTVMSDSRVDATLDPTNIPAAYRDTTTRIYVTTPGGRAFGTTTVNGRPPTVTGVSPTVTPATGTATITITGTGLTGVSQVQFVANDGTTVITNLTSVTVVSDTQVTAVINTASVASGYLGTAQRLYVTNTHGSSYGVLTVPQSAVVPTISSASANGGGQGTAPTIPGISYRVIGSGLSAATSIKLYSADGSTLLATGTGFAYDGATNLDSAVTVAFNDLSGIATPTASMRLVAANSSGSTYVTVPPLAPVVSSIAPSQVDTSSGSTATVTLYGTGFVGWGSNGTSPTVKMMATDGTTVIATLSSVTVSSNTQATAVLTLSGVGSGYYNTAERLYFANGLGSSYVNFKVTHGGTAPTVTAVSPASMLDSDPVPLTVTVTGTGFTGATAITWDGGQTGTSADLTNFTVVSDTQITFKINSLTGHPAYADGTPHDIVVIGASGNSAATGTSADQFAIYHDAS